jgi:hypothetical protein
MIDWQKLYQEQIVLNQKLSDNVLYLASELTLAYQENEELKHPKGAMARQVYQPIAFEGITGHMVLHIGEHSKPMNRKQRLLLMKFCTLLSHEYDKYTTYFNKEEPK